MICKFVNRNSWQRHWTLVRPLVLFLICKNHENPAPPVTLDTDITDLMLADFAFKSFHLWFISSNRCWSIVASSEFPKAFTIFCLFPSMLLNMSLWASISAWMSWTEKGKEVIQILDISVNTTWDCCTELYSFIFYRWAF